MRSSGTCQMMLCITRTLFYTSGADGLPSKSCFSPGIGREGAMGLPCGTAHLSKGGGTNRSGLAERTLDRAGDGRRLGGNVGGLISRTVEQLDGQ